MEQNNMLNETNTEWENEYKFLWNKEKDAYALVKSDSQDITYYSIYSLSTYFFVMVDSDVKTYQLIFQKMIENNVLVFNSDKDFTDYQTANPIVLPPPMWYPLGKKWIP